MPTDDITLGSRRALHVIAQAESRGWICVADLITGFDRLQSWYHELSAVQRIGLSTIKDPVSGCWTWQASTRSGGYGTLQVSGRLYLAHRYMFMHFFGSVPDGLELDHTCHGADPTCVGGLDCRHRRCANPGHIEPVTHMENMLRRPVSTTDRCRRAGHPFDEKNTIRDGRSRKCRTCRNEYQNARARARRAARSAEATTC